MDAMRDSSIDYRTYWLQGGQYYSQMRNLGGTTPCRLPADKVAQIPEADRKAILLETNSNPAFCAVVARIMTTDPNWAHTISNSAKKAIANEMNPSAFPESRGSWPKLREIVQNLLESVHAEVSRGRIPVIAKTVSGLGRLGNLGQFDIIAGLVSAVGGAAASIYGASITAHAQQQVAQIQANAAMQAAQANMAMANAANAMQAAQAQASPLQSAVQAVTSATVGGIPLLALAIPAIGLIIYLAQRKR